MATTTTAPLLKTMAQGNRRMSQVLQVRQTHGCLNLYKGQQCL